MWSLNKRTRQRQSKRCGFIIVEIPDNWPFTFEETVQLLTSWQMGQALGLHPKGEA